MIAIPARRCLLTALLAGGLAVAAPGPLPAQPLGGTSASAVKAAFLYKFGSFVEWPAGSFRTPGAPLVIGIYGDEAVAGELEQIAGGRSVEGHPVKVQRVRDTEDVEGVHILFAGGPRETRAREMLAAAHGPVLTVADSPLGGRPGPVLFFTDESGRVRFGASLTAAAARGLKLSAKLLAVAQQVEGK